MPSTQEPSGCLTQREDVRRRRRGVAGQLLGGKVQWIALGHDVCGRVLSKPDQPGGAIVRQQNVSRMHIAVEYAPAVRVIQGAGDIGDYSCHLRKVPAVANAVL